MFQDMRQSGVVRRGGGKGEGEEILGVVIMKMENPRPAGRMGQFDGSRSQLRQRRYPPHHKTVQLLSGL